MNQKKFNMNYMRSIAKLILLTLFGILGITNANAVPSFARQTGMACVACHIGGFGPHLTDFGIHFKLTGYTIAKDDEFRIPIAGMAIASVTDTSKPSSGSDADTKNKKLSIDQASIFLAGKLSQHAGIFSQVTYDGVAKSTSIDQAEIRFANSVMANGHSVIAGATINNNPGMSDPYNSLPAWGYPFISSAIAPAPSEATLLDGMLALRVLGVTGYTQVDGKWYGEVGTYSSISQSAQGKLGLGTDGDPGVVHGSTYGRLAHREYFGDHSISGGITYFAANVQPDRSNPAQIGYKDIAADLHYQWRVSDRQIFSLLSNVIHEHRDMSSMVALGSSQNSKLNIFEHNIAGSYYWDNTYGLTLQRFGLTGTSDSVLYASGFTGASPNFGGYRIQADWTPFGKQPLGKLDPQIRIGMQYTMYDKFDGSKATASNNNNLMLFAWTLF
jgi:hypothetical protein